MLQICISSIVNPCPSYILPVIVVLQFIFAVFENDFSPSSDLNAAAMPFFHRYESRAVELYTWIQQTELNLLRSKLCSLCYHGDVQCLKVSHRVILKGLCPNLAPVSFVTLIDLADVLVDGTCCMTLDVISIETFSNILSTRKQRLSDAPVIQYPLLSSGGIFC